MGNNLISSSTRGLEDAGTATLHVTVRFFLSPALLLATHVPQNTPGERNINNVSSATTTSSPPSFHDSANTSFPLSESELPVCFDMSADGPSTALLSTLASLSLVEDDGVSKFLSLECSVSLLTRDQQASS